MALDELDKLLAIESELRMSILFLANKIDRPNAMSVHEHALFRGLESRMRDRSHAVFETNAREGVGLQEAKEWLLAELQRVDE